MNPRTRRASALCFALMCCPPAARCAAQPQVIADQRPPVELTEEAKRLHAGLLVIDGHNDMPWEVRSQAGGSFEKLDLARRQPTLHTDIPKLRQGGVGAQFWSVWVPPETAYDGSALFTTLEQIDLVRHMVERYSGTFEMAYSAEDIRRVHADGKIASLIGVEGGHCIQNSLKVLRTLYRLGARYMTLTHADTIDWADSATDEHRHGGLTPFGEEVVREMNRLGMMVDVSHVSPDTMKHTLRVTAAPVIFSHSSARALADHPRNVPDDVLRLVKENNGLVMVNFFSSFVVPETAERDVERLAYKRELAAEYEDDEKRRQELRKWHLKRPYDRGTLHVVIDHIDHIAKVAGVDHVGIGSDYDGVSILPTQLDDVTSYPYITQALLDRGYSGEDIAKIMGGNLLRVFEETERVAKKLKETPPKGGRQ